MQQHEFDEFSTVIQATAELYPQRTLSPTAVALYWQALQDLTLAEIKRALSAHVNSPDTGQFMPKPADIRKVLGGTTADAAALAWSKVIRAARSIGAYETVAFDDPFIHAAISDMGGWPAICHSKEDELPFREREFVTKYRAYRSRGADAISFPPKLVGMADQHNVAQGHEASAVAMIGKPERAERVLRAGGERKWLEVTYKPGEGVKALPAPKLGLLPVRRLGALSDADRAAMEAAEAEIAAREKDKAA